jgi:ParB family chromosome partitioning protein
MTAPYDLNDVLDNLVGASATPIPTPLAMPPTAKPQLVDMRLRDIIPDPANPREDVGDILDLAASMKTAGLLQPIVVRRHEGRYLVVAGHRRLAAAQHLSWETAPVIIRADMRPDEVLAAMLIENGQRRDLDPIEEARAYRTLKAQLHDASESVIRADERGHLAAHSARTGTCALCDAPTRVEVGP